MLWHRGGPTGLPEEFSVLLHEEVPVTPGAYVPHVTPQRVLALADDLSGAAETAIALRVPGRLSLGVPTSPGPADASLVMDLDTRQAGPDTAAEAVRDALALTAGHRLLFKKVDSLLRGNVASEAAAFAVGARAVVTATALPVLGRTVRDGIVHLRGAALHTTDAWRAEHRPPPQSVAAVLTGLHTAGVPLCTVRSGVGHLSSHLRDLAEQGRHAVCDAETDDDLDAVAAATLALGPGFRALGCGGLAAAFGRLLVQRAPEADVPSTPRSHSPKRPLLMVVGTAEPTAVAQIAQLTALGAHHFVLPTRDLLDGTCTLPATLAPNGITVLSIGNTPAVTPSSSRRLADALARTAARLSAEGPAPDLVLTGGETARRTLDALGVAELTPLGQVHHGAVLSRTADGRSVVTRPGSFGDTRSLLRIAHALRPAATAHLEGEHL
ncbi:four-carbon acid sugar kinase family protein [Streptomyces sp. NPDC005794]|uniref:four-carbon acid sugar kinase family protein n=1 Tax=Streptomyces sp. NPDC005794 TaxID=3364733 RepID=UPI0036A670DE